LWKVILKARDEGGIVYSTGMGRICPGCLRPVADCVCKTAKAADARNVARGGAIRVGRETQGRKGKGVTVISGLPLAADALGQLATQLKKRCGSGGTVRDGLIEIQGDHRDVLVAELNRLGWAAKRSGG
jgi:translation initiation factor 1